MAYLKIIILQIESIVPRYKFGVSYNPSGSLEDESAQWILLGLILRWIDLFPNFPEIWNINYLMHYACMIKFLDGLSTRILRYTAPKSRVLTFYPSSKPLQK